MSYIGCWPWAYKVPRQQCCIVVVEQQSLSLLLFLPDHKRRDASLTVALRTVSALHNGCCVVKKGKDDYDDVNQKTRILSFMEVLHAEDWTKSDCIQLLHHCWFPLLLLLLLILLPASTMMGERHHIFQIMYWDFCSVI